MNEEENISSMRSEPLREAKPNAPNSKKYSAPFNLRDYNFHDTGQRCESVLSQMLKRYQNHIAKFCSYEKRMYRHKKEHEHREHLPASPEKYTFETKKFPKCDH